MGTAADGADLCCSSWAAAAWSLSFILTTLRSVITLKLMRSEATGRFVVGVELVAMGAGVEDVVVWPVRISSTLLPLLLVEGRMRRRKRGEEGGVTTLTLGRVAVERSFLAISRGVARKNLLLADLDAARRDASKSKSWRLLLPAEVARKLGMSESSSHDVLSG